VDARGGSEGMPLAEIAQLLVREYGVWDAINLDGGGSTSMAWEDPKTGQAELLNTSSDNPAGRAVATSLAVFARRHAEVRAVGEVPTINRAAAEASSPPSPCGYGR